MSTPTPSFELARRRRDGTWRIYVSSYRRPRRIWVVGLGWIRGRPRPEPIGHSPIWPTCERCEKSKLARLEATA